jgi:hypothetical protein
VIAGEHHERRPRRVAGCREKRTERPIHGGHFAVVRLRRVLRVEGRRRAVRRMRLVDVHPGEPAALLPRDPGAGARDDDAGRPLRNHKLPAGRDRVEPAVVGIEAGRQTKARIERKCADERGCREAGRFQPRRDRFGALRQAIAAVIPDPVLERIRAREDAGVRGQRDDGVRVSKGEADTGSRQRIDVRRPRRAPVAAERVGAQRVDGDEQHVLLGVLRKRAGSLSAGAGARQRHRQETSPPHGRQVLHIPKC